MNKKKIEYSKQSNDHACEDELYISKAVCTAATTDWHGSSYIYNAFDASILQLQPFSHWLTLTSVFMKHPTNEETI